LWLFEIRAVGGSDSHFIFTFTSLLILGGAGDSDNGDGEEQIMYFLPCA